MKAAYNARERLTDERIGEAKDFHRVEGLQFSGIYLLKDAPEWTQDRQQLWNEAERVEKHPRATLARICGTLIASIQECKRAGWRGHHCRAERRQCALGSFC